MTARTPLVELSTTRKVVGSLAILGTAAAVAGLGTYGNFTDSTTPLNTTVETGTLSINLAQPGGAVAIPVTTTGFVPGDSMTRAVNLINDGGSGLDSVSVSSVVTSPSTGKPGMRLPCGIGLVPMSFPPSTTGAAWRSR